MSEKTHNEALEAMEGKTISTMQFNMGSISIIFEDGTDAMLYDQSGVGISPILHEDE